MSILSEYVEDTANEWWDLDENGVAFELEGASVTASSLSNEDQDKKNWLLFAVVGLAFWLFFKRRKKRKKNKNKYGI